ncbi:ubiquitin-specific protease doa4 [Pseudocyphellaria aurata]|nr:ubiquitin-specific protease doa4 [Pseudocyphellaria aurata]
MTSRLRGRGSIATTNGKPPIEPRFPHIKDLHARVEAATPKSQILTPIRTLLGRAKQSVNQASTDIAFKRPDRAYVEYLTSSEILLNVIPSHKDYPGLVTDRGEWGRIYKSLRQQVDSQHEMFMEIRSMIVDDNKRSGLGPTTRDLTQIIPRETTAQGRHSSNVNTRPLSVPDTPTSRLSQADSGCSDPRPRYSSPQLNLDPRPLLQDQYQLERDSLVSKQRPLEYPEPEEFQRRSKGFVGAANPSEDNTLQERFSQLRVHRKPLVGPPEYSPRNSMNGGLVEVSSPIEYTPSSSDGSPSRSYHMQSAKGPLSPTERPSGPREMLSPPSHPPHPPKIPLDAKPELSLPRAPSPAYNPSRSILTSSNTQNQFSRNRSSVNVDPDGTLPPLSTCASQQQSKPTETSWQPTSRDLNGGLRPFSVSSADLTHTTSIKADELYYRLRSYNVLLVDVRSREEFDQGHIFAKSIMCIEPLELRPGVSAEELEDRLVISPAAELSLFERRNEFDLVVYYDRNTRSDKFLLGAPADGLALRALYDTLYEFNAYKPLNRPPVMLIGGLDAWIDFVGEQALQASSTAALIGSARSRNLILKPGRPIGRVPMASSNSSLEVRKRRLREYHPLDAEEDKTWRERARNEEVEASEYRAAQSDDEADSTHPHPEQTISPLVHSYEEFLRKFPEPAGVRQSMMNSAPPPPVRPPPSLPNIPSRPPPAVPRPSYSGVSERETSQLSPTSRQPLSAQPPLYVTRSVPQYLKLPRTGLINFSVTCYMNATIQCLLATIPLSQFFLDNRWRDYIQKNWKGSNGIMPEIFANLVRSLWRNDVQAVRPTSLRNFCARLNREWGVDRQQDAKEYLDFLLDCLHEDLNFNWQNNPLRPLTTQAEMVREGMPIRKVSKLEWDRYSHRESSFISSLFAGQHASRLRCTTCKNTSTTYEAFYSISVEIPRSGRGDIHECLRSYCQEEMLSGDEVWKCSYCKCEREATKQIIITRAPQFLVVHFKRFSASKTESARKVHTPIHFPLHGLNMEPYIVSTNTAATNINHKDSPATGDHAIDAAITPPYIYDAYAVMRHLGQSGNGGHYISLVKDAARGCWRKFDDERATDFDPNKLRPEHRLQNEQAYLVFYGRAAAR